MKPPRNHGPYIPAAPGWFGVYAKEDHDDDELRRCWDDAYPIIAWDLADGGCEPVSACQPEGGMYFDWIVRPDGTVQGAAAGDNDIELYGSVEELVETMLRRAAAYRARVAEESLA